MNRFFDKVLKTDGCWHWLAALRGKSGYGCIKFNGKTVDTHRVSWIIHYGEIPDGLLVCHTCDNKTCVNPKHLFLGTQSDNMQDCSNKGRLVTSDKSWFKKGRKPYNRTLSDVDVLKIKAAIFNRKVNKKTLYDLSVEMGYSISLFRDISSGRIYKDIQPMVEVLPTTP